MTGEELNAYVVVIEDLKRRRTEIDNLITRLESVRPDGGELPPFGEVPDFESLVGSDPHAYVDMSIPEAAIKVLKAANRPLRPAQIAMALEAGGLRLSGKNNANTVNAVLHRRQAQVGDIVSPKRGQWVLREWLFGEKSPRGMGELGLSQLDRAKLIGLVSGGDHS